MAARTQTVSDPSSRFFIQPSPSTSTLPSSPSFLGRIWRWGTSTAVAPLNWGGAAAIEGISTRIGEIVESNESQIISKIQGTVNQALLRQAPPAFAAARAAIVRFLDQPDSAHLAEMQAQLALVGPDQHAPVYQEVSSQGQERIRNLTQALQVAYQTTHHPVIVNETSEESAPLVIEESIREHLNDALSILSFAIMRHNGSLVSALDFLSSAILDEENGLLQRGIDSLKQKFSEEGGLLDELSGRLVSRDNSILGQAVQMLHSELTSTPHETLNQSRIALILLIEALQVGAQRETISNLMLSVVLQLENLDRDKAEIFRVRPLISEEQWRSLREFREYLQGFVRDGSRPLIHPEIQRLCQSVFQCINDAFKGQTGVIEELIRAGDHLANRIEQLLQRIETLPQRLISNTLSQPPVTNTAPSTPPLTEEIATPSSATSEEPPSTAAETTNGSISYNTILERSSSILSQIMETTGQAVSQRAASSLATMMIFIFNKIKSHLEENREHPHIIATIDPLIRQVEAARENGSWSKLIETLQECKQVMQQQQVYLQGFRLPLNSVRSNPSAIPAFLTNISNHDAALHDLREPTVHTTSRQMITEESLKLKLRASAYGPIKLINEYLLRFTPDDSLYASLIAIPPNTPPSLIGEIFKTRYFAWIDQSDRSLASKWLAKTAYYVAVPVFNFFAEALISNTIVSYQHWQDAPEDSLNPKEIHIIQKLRNWLAILSACYNEAATIPSGQVCDFQQLLERAIQAPERNGGLHPTELYGAFSATVLDAYGPRFNWKNSITKYYDVQIPPTSILYFLNPFLATLNIFCNWTISAFLFIPEWIANTAMRWSTQLFLRHSPILERNLSRTIDALKSNTRTSYALNQVIYRQLQRVWESMRVAMTSDGEKIDLQGQYSMSKKLEISRLVEYLFEVLNKSHYGTQDKMRAYLEGRLSIRDRTEREIDDMFFPEALETAISMISLSFDAVMTEEAQNELLFDLLAIANGAMDADEPVSEEECAALEKAIRDQIDHILEASIFYALGEKFDFTGERQKAGVHQFIQDLKDQSAGIATNLASNRLLINPFTSTNPRMHDILRNSIEASVRFQRGRLDALSRADGNRSFHTETKQKLNETSQQLAAHFTPITDHLNHSLRIYEETMQIEQGDHLMIRIDQALTQVQAIFSQQSIQTAQIAQSAQHKENIQEALNQFRSLSPLFINQQQLHSDSNQLQSAISQTQSMRQNMDILMQTLPLFERILISRTQCLGSPTLPAEAKENERILATLIQTLPTSFPHCHLLNQVLNLINAKTPEAIAQANKEYQLNLGAMIQEAEHSLQTSKNLAWVTAGQMKEKVAAYRHYAAQHIAQNQNGLHDRLELLTRDLGTFNKWIEEVRDMAIWNFFVFDMQGITEITKDLAFGRAKQKVNELIEALYQRHNYVGAMHHLVLLPFLKHHGPQYLR